MDETTRHRSNVTWLSETGFSFGAKFFGRDADFDESRRIEIDLNDSSAKCIEGSRCFAECPKNEVRDNPLFRAYMLRLYQSDSGSFSLDLS